MSRLCVYIALCCLFVVASYANTLNLYTSSSDLKYFSFNTPVYASFGVYVQPCSTCTSNTKPDYTKCSNPYCGTHPSTSDSCTLDEQITVNVLLGFEFACCKATLDSANGQCGDTGGKVGGFITAALGQHSFTLPKGQCYNFPTDIASDSAAWQWLGTQDLNSLIKPLCDSTALGWTLALTKGYNRAYASAAIADITWSGNNVVDALYFHGHFAIVPGGSPVPPASELSLTSWDGPTTGITSGVLCDQGDTVNVPPPTVASGAGECTSQCGCYFMNLLNKTDVGTPNAPATRFTFQVCVLCQHGFSYLTVCTGGLPMDGLQGTQCKYSLDTKTAGGCSVIKWATPSCPFQFLKGACDILSVVVYGPSDGFVFQFGGHAGGGTYVAPITIDTKACTCGSLCTTTTPPVVTTTPALPTTTPALTTTNPGDTTPVPTTTVPGQTFPTTTPGATTPGSSQTTPAGTTPNPCADAFTSGADCKCIYTGNDNAAFQAWCKPDGTGNYVWKLLTKDEVAATSPPPAQQGWFRPGTVDSQGYSLGCDCSKKIVPCTTDCSGDTCICNTANGQCITADVCKIIIETKTPEQGKTCPACPVGGPDNSECSNRGVCNCGECVCGSLAGVNYTGQACEVVVGCGQFPDCATCHAGGLQYHCVWCNYGAGAKCLNDGDCSGVGAAVDCSGTIIFEQAPCPDNCSNHGACSSSSNITQCICVKGYHGANCAAKGGLSAAAKAAAISGGVIAAIVICGVIVLVLLSFGAKKAVDHVLLNEQASAKSHISPLYHETGASGTSGLHVPKD